MKLRNKRKFVNRKKRIIYFSLFFMLLFISVGYAYLSVTLSINGHTELSSNTWDIHFANLSITDGSVTAVTPAAIQSNTTSINYSVELPLPRDFYEFEVDVVNSGTLPGKISLVNIQGISSEAEPYLESSIKYKNGIGVMVGDILNPGSSKRIVVRVGYKSDVSVLPEDDIELDLVFTITYTQTVQEEINTDTIIQQLKTENSSCFTKYTGDVTDQVGQTVTANNVYFNNCADKRNIKFAGFCWQMIRTTETNGIRMIYNGEPDQNGGCGSSRGTHKGIVAEVTESALTLNSSYLYGDSFTYDTTNNTFTLTNPITATWSNSTYEDLIGKFTCKNTNGTCITIHSVNGYYDSSKAVTAAYELADTNYAQIGTSPFNIDVSSIANVGYMFNKVYYNNNVGTSTISGALFGNDVSYSNGTYTLLPASGENTLGTTKDDHHHYTCNNTTGTCSKVRFYFSGTAYVELDGEANIDEVVNNMLYANDVNKYNSSIKGIIDAWFNKNLSAETGMLENTVYCNNRTIKNPAAHGWNKDGVIITNTFTLFKNYDATTDLSCLNLTDQFSTSNNKAKLTYPVALIGNEEWNSISSNSLRQTGSWHWTLSPQSSDHSGIGLISVLENGSLIAEDALFDGGVRPAVSLLSGSKVIGGTGSEDDPWVIEDPWMTE